MSRTRWMTAAALLAAGASAPGPASARSSNVVSYPAADVWPTAVRFLRVDRDYTIKEKDETAGYVIFEASENKRPYRGTLELIASTDGDGRAATQIVVTLADLPRHFEVALLDKLSSKLRDERGPPPAPPGKRPPPPQPGTPENPAPKLPAPEPGNLPKPPTWGPEVR